MQRKTIPYGSRRPDGVRPRQYGGRPRVLAICGYVPNPITLRKLDALHRGANFDVHLAFWRSSSSPNQYPFTSELPVEAIHPIDVHVPHPDFKSLPLRVARGNLLLARFHARLRGVIRALQPDLIHASNSNMLICAWLACIGRPDRALVYDLLDTDDGMRRWPVTSIQRLMHRRVDRISVSSPRFVTDFLRPLRLISPECQPTVIANAPWRTTFADIQPRQDEDFVVGYIGSLRCLPAIEWLVESVCALRDQGFDIKILFAGNGTCRPDVERMAAVHPFVTYHGPYDYATEIRALYQRVDAVYAVYDDSPDKRTHVACRLSDAIAAGRAIIVSKGTYMAELVVRHGLGYAVDLEDRASLASALTDAVRHRDRWRDPGRVPADLREAHTFDTYLPALHAIYAAAVERRSRVTP
jgi:glycosyltransferase involved in cell wall biosynthesis